MSKGSDLLSSFFKEQIRYVKKIFAPFILKVGSGSCQIVSETLVPYVREVLYPFLCSEYTMKIEQGILDIL